MSESTGIGEVKVRLVVDSNSEKVTDELKKDLEEVDKKADDTKETAKGGLAGVSASAVAMGTIYAQMAQQAFHYAQQLLGAPTAAFQEQQAQVKQLANSFTILDRGGNSFERIRDLAAEVESNMGAIAMQSGEVGDDLVAAFNDVIERGGKSVEEAEELTEKMAYAGRVVPGGVRAIASGFEMVEMGMIRAKNPIVGLIAATGVLKGNAKSVAAQMQKMTPEQQMKTAEKAIDMMAERAKQIPLTFGQMKNVLGEVEENLLETMGKPLQKGLSAATLRFKNMFIDGKGDSTELMDKLVQGAELFGNTFMGVFEVGAEFVEGFVDGLEEGSKEFTSLWAEFTGNNETSWKEIANLGKETGRYVGLFVKELVSGAMVFAKYVTEAVGLAAELMGKATGSEGMKNFGMKAQQLAYSGEQSQKLKYIQQADGAPKERKEALRREYIETAMATGQNDYIQKLDEAEKIRTETENAVNKARMEQQAGHAKEYYESFAQASKVHDEAAMKNIVSFMGNNEKMAQAIGELGPDVLGSAKDDFIKKLHEMGFDAAADRAQKAARADLKISKANITQNFHGGVHVKQDFKDTDPDRVIVKFKEQLASVGSNRLQARTVGLFGL